MAELLTLEEFEKDASAFDATMAQTPEVDLFCSSTPWVLSAHEAFTQQFETWITRYDAGYVALVKSWHERLGRFRQPLEASWCLASPFASSNPRALVEQFSVTCERESDEWDLLFLSGLVRNQQFYNALIDCFGGRYFIGVGPPVSRFVASLDGGYEAFLSRRSSKFRANLRRTWRKGEEEGVTYEYLRAFDPEQGNASWREVYERILAIERRSWKGKSGTGIIDDPMREFYRRMLPRLAAKGQLRVLFVKQAAEDIAFVFGGLTARSYRGLQLSYDEDFKAFSPGNLAQIAIIQELCAEGIEAYDLGSELEYKSNWAEERFETVSLVIRPW